MYKLNSILWLSSVIVSLAPCNLTALSRNGVDMRQPRDRQEVPSWRPDYVSSARFAKSLAIGAPKFRDEIKKQRAQIEPEDPQVVKSGYYRFGTLASNVLDFAWPTIFGAAGLYLSKNSIDNMSKIPVPTTGYRISDPEFLSHGIFFGIGLALIAVGPITMGAKKFLNWAAKPKSQ